MSATVSTDLPPSRGRWFWWGLLAAVFCMLVVAIAILGVANYRASMQAALIARLERCGGSAYYEVVRPGETQPEYVSTWQLEVGFPGPDFRFEVGKVSGSHTKNISGDFEQIEVLPLSAEETEEFCRVAEEFPKLRSFMLKTVEFSRDQWEAIPTHPNFEELMIDCPSLADDDLCVIGRLAKLKVLKLTSGVVTDTGMYHLNDVRDLEELALEFPNATDDGFVGLKPQPVLKSLRLDTSGVGDRGVTHMTTSPLLQILVLNETQITDAGLIALPLLPELRVLHAEGTRIGNDGVAALTRQPKLAGLALDQTRITDEVGPSLTALPAVDALWLADTAVGDSTCRELAQKELSILDLSGTKVTDAGLRELVNSRVHHLLLDRTQITDDGLLALAASRNISLVEIHETNVTASAIRKLSEANPAIQIECDVEDLEIAAEPESTYGMPMQAAAEDSLTQENAAKAEDQ